MGEDNTPMYRVHTWSSDTNVVPTAMTAFLLTSVAVTEAVDETSNELTSASLMV